MSLPVFILSLALVNPMATCGLQWKMLEPDGKAALVAGIMIGNIWTAAELASHSRISRADATSVAMLNTDVESIVAYLDEFYVEPTHVWTPVGQALFLAHRNRDQAEKKDLTTK